MVQTLVCLAVLAVVCFFSETFSLQFFPRVRIIDWISGDQMSNYCIYLGLVFFSVVFCFRSTLDEKRPGANPEGCTRSQATPLLAWLCSLLEHLLCHVKTLLKVWFWWQVLLCFAELASFSCWFVCCCPSTFKTSSSKASSTKLSFMGPTAQTGQPGKTQAILTQAALVGFVFRVFSPHSHFV